MSYLSFTKEELIYILENIENGNHLKEKLLRMIEHIEHQERFGTKFGAYHPVTVKNRHIT